LAIRSFTPIRPSLLRTNLPNDYEVKEVWVRQFNDALGKIETALNMNLDEFKVVAGMLYRSVGSSNYVTGEVTTERVFGAGGRR
jgi:hypothetical protein